MREVSIIERTSNTRDEEQLGEKRKENWGGDMSATVDIDTELETGYWAQQSIDREVSEYEQREGAVKKKSETGNKGRLEVAKHRKESSNTEEEREEGSGVIEDNIGSDRSSEDSIVELIDRWKLEECIRESREKEINIREKESSNVEKGREEGGSRIEINESVESDRSAESSLVELIDRWKLEECIRVGRGKEMNIIDNIIKGVREKQNSGVVERLSNMEDVEQDRGTGYREEGGGSVVILKTGSSPIEQKDRETRGKFVYQNREGSRGDMAYRHREELDMENVGEPEEEHQSIHNSSEERSNREEKRRQRNTWADGIELGSHIQSERKLNRKTKEWNAAVRQVEGEDITRISRVQERQNEREGRDMGKGTTHKGHRNEYRDSKKKGNNRRGDTEERTPEIDSDKSSIDLVDRQRLGRCIQQSEGSRDRERIEGGNPIGELQVRGNKNIGINEVSEEQGRKGNIEIRDRNREKIREDTTGRRNDGELDSTGEREVGRGRIRESIENTIDESSSTTSSIAALFRDKQLEREGKRVGRKNITRRKVWERWKGVIRGEIRRKINKDKKVVREIEEKEDRKVVFDYTTKGLTGEEVKLLGKGEAFCIVDYKIDEDRSKVDIYQYQRRLRLHEVFRDPGVREEESIEEIRTPTGRGESGTQRDRYTGRDIGRISVPNTQGRGSRGSTRNIRGIGDRGARGVGRYGSIRRDSVVSLGVGTGNRGIGIRTQGRGGRESVARTRGRTSTAVGASHTQNRRGSTEERERTGVGEKEGRRLPSIYDPESQNRNLHRYNSCIQEEIMLVLGDKKVKFRDNVTKEERVALKTLKQRIEEKEIIITRADKGSGLVALDYEKYICKGTHYIEEEAKAYSRVQETQQEIISKLTKERDKIAEELKEKGVIEIQTATYVKKQLEEKITGIKFYYKIHKDKKIDSMPLRPLQSCIKAPMQHLSIVLTDILQPLLIDRNIPSFIFDTNQLLYRLKKLGKIPSNCTLISSDVSALYPSIPHEAGFRAMRGFLQRCTTYSRQQIGSIIKALELVITENYVTWDDRIYKQTSGVAMGTPVAVAYANIFMDWVDGEVRSRAPYIFEHIRYIDDNLFILPGDKVQQLMEIANNILPPYIKFTYESLEARSGRGLPFLDTQLFIHMDGTIESRLYTKETDRHAYLLPSSYHPPHVTRNIPLAVFGRLRKICSREEWFEEDVQKAEGWLVSRGYKKREIQKAIGKSRQKDRWDMIEKIESNRKKERQRKEEIEVDIPLIMTYNQHVGKIRQILKDRQPLLESAFKRTKVRPRLSFRRKRNLNDRIIQKSLRGPIESNRVDLNVFTKCGETPGYRTRCPCKGKHSHSVCRCCSHSKEVIEGVDCKVYKPVNCNSKNVVYVIGCKQCSKRYVGETQQRLKDRLAQHMYNIDKLNQPLYLHFRHVHKLENMYIGVVETVRGVEPFMRKVREAWWINNLKTLEPSGFNVKLECNQIYEETG